MSSDFEVGKKGFQFFLIGLFQNQLLFIKLNRLDGTGTLFGPAPQSMFEEARPADRLFTALVGGALWVSGRRRRTT